MCRSQIIFRQILSFSSLTWGKFISFYDENLVACPNWMHWKPVYRPQSRLAGTHIEIRSRPVFAGGGVLWIQSGSGPDLDIVTVFRNLKFKFSKITRVSETFTNWKQFQNDPQKAQKIDENYITNSFFNFWQPLEKFSFPEPKWNRSHHVLVLLPIPGS